MAKPRKPSSNAQAFEREVKRLQRLVKIAENKGIVFISSPIPEKPDVVTRKKLNFIQSITKSDIESKGYTLDEETGELQNYVPPKQSKPRTTSPRSYTAHTSAPHIPTPPKPKLSEEELHKVRSESAKKAREARRKWEQEHPEEAHERRSKSAKKAAETRRRREQEDAEYKKRVGDIRKKSLEKAREAKRKKREQEQQEQPKPQTEPEIPIEPDSQIEEPEPEEEPQIEEPQEEPDYSELPSQGDAILANVRAELTGAVNSHIAQYLLDLLEDEIDANGEDVVIERLATASERAIEMANGASYASDSDDVANCAYSLADLITGGDIGGFMAEEIEQLAFEDRPYRRKRR